MKTFYNEFPGGGMRSGKTLLLMVILFLGLWTPRSFAMTEECVDCHGATPVEAHGDISHAATLGSGAVQIFADTGHDDGGWYGPKPYFAVSVDCGICHASDLLAIHGNSCWTCHTAPYDAQEKNWGGGCQQEGCHPVYHADSTTAHTPFEDPYDYDGNDCYRCHEKNTFSVVQSKCLNCHAPYSAGDVTPPVTTSDARSSYNGPAVIAFSIAESGKVGLGTTFSRLDGGDEKSGSKVIVTEPGPHTLEFWSVDQAGNIEPATNRVDFTTVEDTSPPTTISDAQASYSKGGLITLTASDDSDAGVKNTFYSLNGAPVQTGTSIIVPSTTEEVAYILEFWSEDWSGNIEPRKSVSFTTTGSGTIRLVWWNSDLDASTRPSGSGDKATWYIYKGRMYGELVARGSARNPGWNGVNDVSVPASSTPYFVRVDWYDSNWDWADQSLFRNVYVTEPGETDRLSY